MEEGARKPKTLRGDIAEASQPRADGGGGREAEEIEIGIGGCVLPRRDTVPGTPACERLERGGDGEGKAETGAGFLVYRGINPYPQLPFVLGTAWSTC